MVVVVEAARRNRQRIVIERDWQVVGFNMKKDVGLLGKEATA